MNVLLLTIDALRRDRCMKVMHRFQEWARERAVFFANHYTVAHCSDPNYLSMLSGLHPDNHGIYGQIRQAEEEESWEGYPAYASLWRWLKVTHGHKVSGYTATYPRFYYHAFDEVTPMGRNVKTKGEWVTAKRFMRAAADEGKPWGFFIRTMDCHEPYCRWDKKKQKHIPGKYNSAVRWTDQITMDLIEHVLGEYPDTIIVFCSDHGEALAEHGYRGHFSTLYQELLRVPCYVYWPGCPGGAVVKEYTQHIDIFPTILDLFDDKSKKDSINLEMKLANMDGLPMTWAMGGAPLRQAMTFVAQGVMEESYQEHRAMIAWPWKYIATADVLHGPKFELYNLRDDPKERIDLAVKRLGLTVQMAESLATSWPYGPLRPVFFDRAERFVRPTTAKEWEREKFDMLQINSWEEESIVKERLAALGYAG